MSLGIHGRSGGWGVGATTLAGLLLATVLACEPSAPPGVTAPASPAGGASVAPGSSVAVPNGSGLVVGQPVVTTDGGKVTVIGLGVGKSGTFDLPAGSATMVIAPCAGGVVSPFVTLYDGKDNKVGLTVDPTTTLKNLVGGSYYLDVSANPKCVWSVSISPI